MITSQTFLRLLWDPGLPLHPWILLFIKSGVTRRTNRIYDPPLFLRPLAHTQRRAIPRLRLLIKCSSINFLLLNVGTTDSNQWQRSLEFLAFGHEKRVGFRHLWTTDCVRNKVSRVWTRHKLLESENRSGIAVFLVSIFLFLRRRVFPPPSRSRLNIKSMERIERHVCRVGDTRGMKSPPTRRSWNRIPGDVWRQKWFPTALHEERCWTRCEWLATWTNFLTEKGTLARRRLTSITVYRVSVCVSIIA